MGLHGLPDKENDKILYPCQQISATELTLCTYLVSLVHDALGANSLKL